MRRIVITLAILIGLLVAADFGTAAIAEYQVSKRAKEEFNLTDDPSVRIGGFSFLLQAISGEYEHVTVDAEGVPVQDTLRDVTVHADLYGVIAPLSELLSGAENGIRVREVEGRVTVKATDVSRAIARNENAVVKAFTNLTIDPSSNAEAHAEPGEQVDVPVMEADVERTEAWVRMCATADVAGEETDICVFGIISLADGKIDFSPEKLRIENQRSAGSLPKPLERQVLEPFAITLDPGALPFEVTPTAIRVDPGALTVQGKAKNVVFGG